MNREIAKTKRISKEIILLPIIFFIIPPLVFAAGVTDLLDAAFDIVTNTLVPLAFSLCLLYFFWGVAKYIKTGAGSEEAAKEGKKIMIWGIIGLFIAFSIWGIISFIKKELTIPSVNNPSIAK